MSENKAALQKMTVVQLRKKLTELGLKTDGLKKDLVDRLASAMAGSPPQKDDAAEASSDEEEDDDDSSEEEVVPVSSRARSKRAAEEDPELEPPSKAARSTNSESTSADWKKDGSLLVLAPKLEPATSIYGFDMDDTLIATKSGKVFATGRTDWRWLFPAVPEKLRELHKEGKRIVIFTNQSGIGGKGYDKSKERMICGKIEDIIKELGIPVIALVATADDVYRKPATDMWDYMAKNINGSAKLDLASCRFIGDAAGRPERKYNGEKRKKDFSCSDRKFANNIGIGFKTPEEFFGNGMSEEFDWDGVDPATIPTAGNICEGGIESLVTEKQEMIIFVGFPASGKSTFAKTYLVPKGYFHVNRDTLKTQEKCLKAAEIAIGEGKSVVIDNTNPEKTVRSSYIQIAKKHGVPVRCFRFMTEEKLAQHLNFFRERITNGESEHVPRIGYNMYKKKFQEPATSEGFSEIKKINFVANLLKEEDKASFFHRH